MRDRPGTRIALPALLFFGSGALGLGYELVWIKQAALVVGASQMALSTVLTAFFLGLAAGSVWFADHVRSRRHSPLYVYGILELLIGAYALALPWLFRLLELAYAAAYDGVSGSAALLFALRFALLFALFFPPTFMMGGTLPLLLDGLVEKDASVGRRTGLLYGINLLGAVSGVLATGYWAIPLLGLSGTSRVAALGNLAIGGVAWLAYRRLEPFHREPDATRLGVFFPALALASGLISIGFQVAWARYFSLFNFNLVYLTALLLAVYLLALSAGSLLVGGLLRTRVDPLRILAVSQALVPAAALALVDAWRLAVLAPTVAQETSGGVTRALPTLELDHDAIWHLVGETVDRIFLAPLFQLSLVLFLPVLLMGMGLPALIAAATRRSRALRSVSGRLMFWNTLGAGLGGFAAGYLLLPLLGLHWTLLGLGLGSLGMSLAAQLRLWRAGARRGGVVAAGATLLSLAVAAGLYATREDLTRRTLRAYLTAGEGGEEPEFRRLIEGPLTTAWVAKHQARIRIGSGAVQMAEAPLGQVSGQIIAGHLAPIFYPDPRDPSDVLGICVGSGQTFGAMLRHSISAMDLVDISPAMTALARDDMAEFNNGLGHDPRVRFHLDDGRHFVQRAPENAYDIVALEPPPPHCEGVHNLYSWEFYREVKRVLRPGGVFSQWLPLYFMTPQETLAAVRTATEVFPYCFLAKLHIGDYILLGYQRRPTFSTPDVERRAGLLAEEWRERSLGPTGWVDGSRHVIGSLVGITASLVLGPDSLAAVESPAILRDDRQQLGYGLEDRWLLRRYQGIPLVDISYAALPIERISSPVSFFAPPLRADVSEAINRERVTFLRSMKIQDPLLVERKQAALRAERDPRRRVRLAMSLALDFDAALKKEAALRHLALAVETALRAGLDPPPQMLGAVREIARNRLAVYEKQVSAWLASLPASSREAAALAPLHEELRAYRARQAEIARRYLLR